MDWFVKYKEYPVLLMSTGVMRFWVCGSYKNHQNGIQLTPIGLDLTAAIYVYIIEPHLNPSVESQAIRQVARLGQNNEVTIVHCIVRLIVEVVCCPSPLTLFVSRRKCITGKSDYLSFRTWVSRKPRKLSL